MIKSLKFFFTELPLKKWTLLIVLLILTLLITIQNINFPVKHFWNGEYTHYNNYVIFKQSFFHLIENKNLYDFHPSEYGDLYKYSPSFAMIIGLIAWLPDWAGLFLWNALNIFVLYFAILKLPQIEHRKKVLMIFFMLFELILSTQNSQSNALMAGLTIWAYNYMEREKPQWATLMLTLASFIKIFSLSACLLVLLYPKRIKTLSYFVLWFGLIALMPLSIVSFDELWNQYVNWGHLLANDHSDSLGMGIYQYTAFILPDSINKIMLLLIGIGIILAPLALIKKQIIPTFRLHYLCLLLLWVVVFNHKAESPTFIIAIAGCAIWGLHQKKIQGWKQIVMWNCLLLTSFITTDLCPRFLKEKYLNVYYIKPIMSIVILGIIVWGMMLQVDKEKKVPITN